MGGSSSDAQLNRWAERPRHVAGHGGYVVKTAGDGYMVASQSARRAVQCAIAIQRDLVRSEALAAIRVRVGLHTGEPVKDGGDFFGTR